jgi:hypothetical protein
MTRIDLMKGINEKIALIDKRLWNYFNLMYSEESNEIFDEEHDNLYWHLQGWNEERREIYEEMHEKGTKKEDLIRILESLDKDLQFTIDVQLYHQSTQQIHKKPRYIYS